MPGDLPPESVALLGSEPSRFTADRDALARRFADGGDTRAAAAVRKLRRPVGLAWILNRLAREREDDVAGLLEAGQRLAAAHRAALAGRGASALRDADDVLRAATRALRAPAEAALREAGRSTPPGALARVEQLLRAAALGDEPTREALRAGTFTREPDVAATGGGAFGLAIAPGPAGPAATPRSGRRERDAAPAAAARTAAAGRERGGRTGRDAAEARRRDAKERARQRAEEEARARAAARERSEARRAVDAAQRAAAAARRELERAERAAAEARRAADEEAARAERARARAAEADAELARRREAMEAIGADATSGAGPRRTRS